ncbi:hypothetical protein, partial [Oenococcus oeni]|uniref:hypothetical protein n=1 Tax=Oenococcus oeni TaxID=1247 RepID=UPI000A49ECEA
RRLLDIHDGIVLEFDIKFLSINRFGLAWLCWFVLDRGSFLDGQYFYFRASILAQKRVCFFVGTANAHTKENLEG